MKSSQEVWSMLDRFEQEGDDCDTETEAVRDALTWVLGGVDDSWVLGGVDDYRVTQYLSD
jgi:hypothetical protein